MAKSKKVNTKKTTDRKTKTLISGDKRYVRRDDSGRFVESTISQVRNSSTGNFIVRDSVSGELKSYSKPYRGVRTNKTEIKSNPNINKSVARKAEKAVISVKSKKK